jgi:hypothetical protein
MTDLTQIRVRAAMFPFPRPDHLPCPSCGASLARGEDETHECEEERLLDYLVLQHRDELERFDGELRAWLGSPAGRFAEWLAAQTR